MASVTLEFYGCGCPAFCRPKKKWLWSTLCEADHTGLFRFDGDLIHFVAHHGRTPEEISAAQRAFPQPPRQHSVTGSAILAAAVVQIADVSKDPELEDVLRIFRTVLSVPLIRDGRPLGAITVTRRVVRPFTDTQIVNNRTFSMAMTAWSAKPHVGGRVSPDSGEARSKCSVACSTA